MASLWQWRHRYEPPSPQPPDPVVLEVPTPPAKPLAPEVNPVRMGTGATRRRPRPKITKAEEREFILRSTRGESYRKIASDMGRHYMTVYRYVKQPALTATHDALKELDKEDAREVRQIQKGRLLRRLAMTTDKACDLVDDTLTQGNAAGFEKAMTGVEKLDRVSGSASGESLRGEATPTVTVDLKVLIQQILGRPAEIVTAPE